MKRKAKCYATPAGSRYCDGCNTIATKCPYRHKYRKLRSKVKQQTEKEVKEARFYYEV